VRSRKDCSRELITECMKCITVLDKEDMRINPLMGLESRPRESSPSATMGHCWRDGVLGQHRFFPPAGRTRVAALGRAVVDEIFQQVIEAAIRSRDGPSHYPTK